MTGREGAVPYQWMAVVRFAWRRKRACLGVYECHLRGAAQSVMVERIGARGGVEIGEAQARFRERGDGDDGEGRVKGMMGCEISGDFAPTRVMGER
ncbi:hypothetical protein MRB53_006464 [Persea americana]|uniref:Uncharacterized protein n=1 Tax=Persea americana TaxID=3435 RepID=A0ACC2MGG2_PERAE|nr:hypothetical protein MRB53_006464 [Persea americana]